MNKLSKSLVAVAAVAASVSAFASTPVTLSFAGTEFTKTSPTDVTNPQFSAGNFLTVTGAGNVVADEFNLKSPSFPTLSGSFAAYCTNPFISIADHPLTALSSVNYFSSVEHNHDLAALFQVSGFKGFNYYTDGVISNTQTAALQLAIWEVSFDGLAGFNASTFLSTGGLQATGVNAAVKAQAISYLTAAKSATVTNDMVLVFRYKGEPGSQPLVTTIPEPSTYALLAACLGVVGLASRRKSAV